MNDKVRTYDLTAEQLHQAVGLMQAEAEQAEPETQAEAQFKLAVMKAFHYWLVANRRDKHETLMQANIRSGQPLFPLEH